MGKVLHASGSGYFPFCIQESSSDACVFPLETIMKIYWRVKKFRLTGAGTGTLPPPSPLAGTEVFFTFDPVEIPQMYANSEENLVCASEFYFDQEGNFGGIGLNEGTISKKELNLFSLDFSVSFGFDSLSFIYGFNAFGGLGLTTNSPHSLIIFGVSMPIFITVDGFGDENNMGGSMQLTLTPIEYWSYGGTYNTSTGEPL